jgi:hypothetical protein
MRCKRTKWGKINARGLNEEITPFVGLMDQIEIIGTALPEKQVQQLHQRGQWIGR